MKLSAPLGQALRRTPRLPWPHLYVHIPKTAGTSLGHIVELSYGRRHSLIQWAPPSAAEARRWAGRRAVIGHLPWDMHRWLPDPAVPHTYVTILRDPVARVWSHFNYNSAKMGFGGTLDDWLHKHQGRDQMTQMVSGLVAPATGPRFERDDPARLPLALERIDHGFGFVGLTERFDDSLVLMADLLGVLPYIGLRLNRGVRQAKGGPTEAQRAAIRAANPRDVVLYEAGQRRFSQHVAAFGGEEALARAKAHWRSAPVRAALGARRLGARATWQLQRRVAALTVRGGSG